MHRVLITSVLLYLTTLTMCQLTINDLQPFSENDIFNGENIEPVTTTGLTAGLTCSTISQCQQLIQQLEQQVQGIESQLTQSTNGEELTENETPKTIKKEFTVPTSGLHYYTQAIPAQGAFYIWAQGAGQDNVGVYLSSTCNCNNNPTYIPATQTRNCQSFTSEASGLTETAPEKCTVFYTVATISPDASVFVWFFPLKSLLRNTIQKIQFPYDNSYRFFTETIEAKDLPVTFYLRSFGGNPSISTQVFATVDCLDSCVQTSYFTHFPTSGSNCYSSVTSGTESYLSITLTQTCTIYYSIISSKQGVSAQLGTYVYQTLPVKNNDLTTVYYPIPNTYRTFYQDIGPYSIFYVTSYGLGQAANNNVPIYVTANCTGSCVNSADYTAFPTSEQNCWQYTFNAEFKSSGGYCRVYYSVFSSFIRDTVRLKTFQYPLKQIPLNTPTPIIFPYDNSYRWFYAEIDSISSSFGFGTEYFNINTVPTDAGMTPLLYVTHNCTTQCSQSPEFTHFPTKSRSCLSGSTNYALNLNGANVPCHVYYGIYSTSSGAAVNLRTSLSTL